MAKGKGKKVSSGGPHKKHGPKKHLFKEYKPMIKVMADTGILSKYYNFESWQIACQARGKRTVGYNEFAEFSRLSLEAKREYFKNLRNSK